MQSNFQTSQNTLSTLKSANPRSRRVYTELLSMLHTRTGQVRRRVVDNLSIPNIIRISDLEVEIFLEEIGYDRPIQIKELCRDMEQGTIDMHVVSHPIKISNKTKSINETADLQTTWMIGEEEQNYYIRAVEHPAVIAMEYRKNPQSNYNPKLWKGEGHLDNSIYTPTEEDFKWRKSFLRRYLEKEEIKQHLLFLDAEFACQMMDKSCAPLSVTILDGEGKTVMDSLVTPRHRILKLGEQIHGISERRLRKQKDEYEVLKIIRELCKGKILVGHDLQMELNHLAVEKKSLLGVFDLSTAKVFEKRNIFPTGNGQLYKLKNLAYDLLKEEIQQPGQHNSREDALAIYDIYKKIENEFLDEVLSQLPGPSKQILPIVKITEKEVDQKNSDAVWKDPMINILEAWNQEPVDLDFLEPELEIFEEEVILVENRNIPSCSQTKNLITPKRQLTFSGISEVDISPRKEAKLVHDELIVNGEVFRRQMTDIEYCSDSGQKIFWRI